MSDSNVIESDSRIIARLSDMVVITSKIGQNWKVEVFDLDPLVAQVIDLVPYFGFEEAVDLHDCLVRTIESMVRKDFDKVCEIRKDLASCKVPNYGIIRYGGDFFYLEDLGVLLSMLFSYFEGLSIRPAWREHYIKKIERIRETLAHDSSERRRLKEAQQRNRGFA